MFIIRFAIYFSISFLILSIPLKNGSLYDKIQSYAAPSTERLFDNTKAATSALFSQFKKYGSKLFTNILPERKKSDRVNSKRSAPKRELSHGPTLKPEDSYTQEETRLLEKILKETHY